MVELKEKREELAKEVIIQETKLKTIADDYEHYKKRFFTLTGEFTIAFLVESGTNVINVKFEINILFSFLIKLQLFDVCYNI